MNYIIIDLEMNPIANEYKEERKICNREIIEIGAVVMDEQYWVLGKFKTLVKPEYNSEIIKRYETLTGITTDMVSQATTFRMVLEMLVS